MVSIDHREPLAGPAGDDAGLDEAVAALAAGRALPAALADRLEVRDPLVGAIAAADAVCRVAGVSVAQARELVERACREAPERPLLRWWATAVLAERALLDTDLAVVPLAAAAAAEMPDEVFGPPAVLFVRGRLRRVASALYLAVPSCAHREAHRAVRDAAIGDFIRAGHFAEVALTRVLCAAFVALAAWEDMPEVLVALRDARACLAAGDGAAWLPLVDGLRLLVALNAGDLDELTAASTALAGHGPVLHAIAAVGQGCAALVRGGGDDASVAELAAVHDRLRRDHPPFLALAQLQAANLLADMGRAGAARRFGLAALDWPPVSPLVVALHELLRHRLALAGDRSPPADPAPRLAAVEDVLDGFAALGHARAAGTWALRLAPDFERACQPGAAEALRRRGEEVVPTGWRRTPAEHRWATPGAAQPSPPPSAPVPAPAALTVRLLGPVVEVEVDGRPRPLRDMAAKLLLILLVAHPAPLHVEQAADVLWPDGPPGLARRRLNTVVHRLRGALGVGPGVIRRQGDVLLVDPARWCVDLFELRGALAGSGDGRTHRRALASVRGLLAEVQFPYDDRLIDARGVLAAHLTKVIGELVIGELAGGDDPGLGRLRDLLRDHGYLGD